ncbi:MAG: response regulator transcription factor [Bryobacterales bacterium]|nr:response regulator transcription factor [Bryobacterales bacterium]
MIRILLADDHSMIRHGLRLLLEEQPDFLVVGEAADGREAVQLAEALKPDVALLDVRMPNLNGIEAARRMMTRQPNIAIIMLSIFADEGYVLRSLKAGACGYLLKESPEADLIYAIRCAFEGKAFFSPSVSRILLEDYMRKMKEKGVDDSFELLTPREREILQLVAEGKSNKEIAQLLNLSLYTVETHRGNVLEKLNLHSVPELTLYAVRKGVIS